MFRPTGYEIGGMICALLGFLVHISEYSSTTVNGVTTVNYSIDYGRLLMGVLAVACAGQAAWQFRTSRIRPVGSMGLHVAVAAVIGCIGLYHLAAGSGVV